MGSLELIPRTEIQRILAERDAAYAAYDRMTKAACDAQVQIGKLEKALRNWWLEFGPTPGSFDGSIDDLLEITEKALGMVPPKPEGTS